MTEEYTNPELEADECEDEEDFDDTIVLTDENGEESEFELLDSFEYKEREYVVLFPLSEDENEDDNDVIILVVEECNEDTGEETFGPVEDEDTLNAVFDMFKERNKDEFNFAD